MFKTLFKKKCRFKIGDKVYPKEQFSNLYYIFPKGPLPVLNIREGDKETGGFVIQVRSKQKNWIHVRALKFN